MQAWQVALLVLAAVFVGMWIPVSLQLVRTLRAGQGVVAAMGTRAEQTLRDVSVTTVALNQTLSEVKEVAHAAAQIKESIRIMSSIGAAVGPAAIALVRALREPEPEQEPVAAPGNHRPPVAARRSTPSQKESSS